MGNGSNVVQWDCHDCLNQKWEMIFPDEVFPAAVAFQARLKASHSQKCMDVAASSMDDGGNVPQWDCHDGPNQNWHFVETGELLAGQPTYFIKNVNSGKCLDVASFGQADGVQIWQWRCNEAANQKWLVEKKPPHRF